MDFPTLNADALASLTKKIEAKFQKAPAEHKKSQTKLEQRAALNGGLQKEKGKKRLRNGEVKQHTEDPTSKLGAKSNKSKSKKGKDPEDAASFEDVDEDKFISDINIQRSINEKPAVDSKADRKARKKAKSSKHDDGPSRAKLQEDILALGGTQEDLELVEGAGSGSEIEDSTSRAADSNLSKDVQNFMKDLGIYGGNTKARSTSVDISEVEEAEVQVEKVKKRKSKKAEQPRKAEQPKTFEQPRRDNEKTRKVDSVAPVKPKKSVWDDATNSWKKVEKTQSKPTSRFIFEPLSAWHAAELPSVPVSIESSVPSTQIAANVHSYAKKLLEKENEAYAQRSQSKSSAQHFYSTVMTSGTLSDKISALTLSVQESPVHNTKALEALVGLARKRSRGQAIETLGALKDLLGPGGLLPSDRKLRYFSTQPSLHAVLGTTKYWEEGNRLPDALEEVHLVAWGYEDWLKTTYFEILKILETWCNDEVVYARGKAVEYVYELLRDKPEQEANLLRLLVNKLGDQDKKVASKTSYQILQLETSHPLMKPTIISAIESDVLFRPRQSLHAKYYAVITLNQTVLSAKEEEVAKKLLDIYFTLFTTLLKKSKKKEDAVVKLPMANAVIYNKKGERQGGGGAAGKKAKQKAALEAENTSVEEELREKMLSAVLTGVNRAIPFAKTDDEAFEKHLDTLFKVTHSSNFNTSIQALLLIQQLSGAHQAASYRFYRTLYESLLDSRLLTSSKQTMYLNLLFKALRAEVDVKRVKAFVKRLLQVVAMHQASFACGVIYLIRKLEEVFAGLQALIDQPEENEIDEEEEFHDVPEEGEENQSPRATAIEAKENQTEAMYDGRKRQPEYSNADKSCLWEISPFLTHFHPSVTLFATKLLTRSAMPEKPDLSMHTLINFLDRFVYRNPKKSAGELRGSSIMQPLAGTDSSGLLVTTRAKNTAKLPLNTDTFRNLRREEVGADEAFFHKYFNSLGKKGEDKKKEKKKSRDGDGRSEDEENEEEIWKALVDSRPEIEGIDVDDDLGMDDLEGLESDSEANAVSLDGEEDDGVDIAEINDDEEMAEADSSDGGPDFGEEEDDAVFDSDDEVDLDAAFMKEVQSSAVPPKEKGKKAKDDRKSRKKKLKNLPTFASMEEYAAILGGGDDHDDEDMQATRFGGKMVKW